MSDSKRTDTVWRDSASLILVAKDETSQDAYDYKILMLKRTAKTAMFHNQVVFPGGLFELADQDIQWIQLYEEFGITQEELKSFVIVDDNRPPVLAPQGNGCYDRFFKKTQIWAREITMRIAAIRETFEEVGILLCRSQTDLAQRGNGYSCVYEHFDKVYWQNAVHQDAKEFLRMCRELKVVPDLWSLYEWSAWTSPAYIKKGAETAFFITFLTETAQTLAENTEVNSCMWSTPQKLKALRQTGDIKCMVPQIYELARLQGVVSFAALFNFANERSRKGLTMFLSVNYLCTDGLVSVQVGDDFYPKDARNVTSIIQMDCTIKDFQAKAKHLHRVEYDMSFSWGNSILNFEPFNGHLAPVQGVVGMNKL